MMNRTTGRIRLVAILTAGSSLLAILGGLLHLLVPLPPAVDNAGGSFFLIALVSLNLLIYLQDRAVERGDYLGRRLHRRGYLHLAALMGGLPLLAGLNMLPALIHSSRFNGLIYGGIYLLYFGLPAVGFIAARESLMAVEAGFPLRWGPPPGAAGRGSGGKKAVRALCSLLLIAETAGLYIFFSGDRSIFYESAPQFAEIFLSGYSLYHALLALSAAVLLLKVQRRPDGAGAIAAGSLGLLCLAAYLLPLAAVPATCARGEAEFARVFGEAGEERFAAGWGELFRAEPFSLPAYFLGFPPGEYRWERDVLFYEGSGGVDEGLKLHGDIFMPPESGADLPGRGAALIRIHGGAWVAGDKGYGNMMQVNKYFASQGYTVFDVQYGLTDRIRLTALQPYLGQAPGRVGPFTLDDMVRHLGIFTRYLADHALEYGLDPGAVFISGGSAGGQLTTAVALAMAGGGHGDLFSDELGIRGYLPLYPANSTSFLPAIGGAPEWLDVALLVDGKSPPCLLYQGRKDGQVSPESTRQFQEAYIRAGNEQCALLEFDWAGHASDFYFPGIFNQIWIYHMERFLALHR